MSHAGKRRFRIARTASPENARSVGVKVALENSAASASDVGACHWLTIPDVRVVVYEVQLGRGRVSAGTVSQADWGDGRNDTYVPRHSLVLVQARRVSPTCAILLTNCVHREFESEERGD